MKLFFLTKVIALNYFQSWNILNIICSSCYNRLWAVSQLPQDPKNHKPLYDQLRELILNKIVNGEYAVLSQIPSENEFAEQFGVSRITVRQALNQLQLEGYIFKVPGKGTFVSKPKTFQNISSLQGFAEAMSSAGHEILNRVISAELKQIPMYVVPKLKLPVKANVYEIQRVRLLNRQPVSYELTYLPEHIGLKLKEKAIDLRTTDIFKALEQECDIPLGHADLSIDATVADEELAALLQVEIGTPVLRVERLTHDANGQPIDYEYLYFSGDTFQYRLRIHR